MSHKGRKESLAACDGVTESLLKVIELSLAFLNHL